MWKANKFVNILLWVLALISVVICGIVFAKAGSFDKTDPAQFKSMMNAINPMFIWAYVLVGLTLLLAVGLSIPQAISNPKSARGVFIGIVGFAAVVGIAFAMSKSNPLPFSPGHAPVSAETLKFADVNIISSYIMLGGTLLAVLYTSITNVFKSK